MTRRAWGTSGDDQCAVRTVFRLLLKPPQHGIVRKTKMPRDPSHTPPLLRKAHRLHAKVWKMWICCICHIHTVYTRRWSQGIEPLHGVEVIALIRGGGSLEDLAAFNSREVAYAVFGSLVPVVVGVGHEQDVSIADFVADVRASTPSNAAELIAPQRESVAREVAEEGGGRGRGGGTHG